MIPCTTFTDRIDAYLDRSLGEKQREAMEGHAAVCPRCRRDLDRARELERRIAELPCSVDPPRDLFPAIRASIESGAGTAPHVGRGRSRGPAWIGVLAAAAAVLLVLVTASLVRRPLPGAASPTHSKPADAVPSAWQPDGPLLSAGQDYRRAVAELSATLERRSAALPPEDRAVIRENLAIIDNAIAEVERALRGRPVRPEDSRFLADLRRQKIQVLWRASRLSS